MSRRHIYIRGIIEIAIVRLEDKPRKCAWSKKGASGSGAKLRIYDNYHSCVVETAKTEDDIAAICKDLKSTGKGTIVHTTSNEKEVVPQATTQSSLDVEVKMQPL
jgi:hypothetical protein